MQWTGPRAGAGGRADGRRLSNVVHSYVLWRAIGAVLAASGVAAVIAAFALPPNASNDLRGALAVYGFGALIFGGVGALWAQTRMRVQEAEAHGGDVQAAAAGDPRWRGGALVVVGVALIAIMVAVISATELQLLFPGRAFASSRFTGTPKQGRFILADFIGLLAFGAAAVAYGVWQVRTGRQDKRVMVAASALLAVLLAVVAML